MRFSESVTAAERAARMAEGGFAFAFKEGALVKALRQGHWVLLDEINLAPSEASSQTPVALYTALHNLVVAETVSQHRGHSVKSIAVLLNAPDGSWMTSNEVSVA